MKWVIVDGNSVGHAAQNSGKRKLKAGSQETTAIYSTIRILSKHLGRFPQCKPLVLWDGRSHRYNFFPDYKGNRNQTPEQQAERKAYKSQTKIIAQFINVLGLPQMLAGNMEADDLAAMTTDAARARGDSVALLTGDQDWLQLVEHGVQWIDHRNGHRVDNRNFTAETGYHNARAFVDGKSLQGDTGDNIKPRTGIGEKGARELLDVYGTVDDFLALSDEEVLGVWQAKKMKAALPGKYRKLRDDKEIRDRFLWSRSLVDLRSPIIPKPERISKTPGRYDEGAFRSLCMRYSFNSVLDRFDDFLSPFRSIQENNS